MHFSSNLAGDCLFPEVRFNSASMFIQADQGVTVVNSHRQWLYFSQAWLGYSLEYVLMYLYLLLIKNYEFFVSTSHVYHHLILRSSVQMLYVFNTA